MRLCQPNMVLHRHRHRSSYNVHARGRADFLVSAAILSATGLWSVLRQKTMLLLSVWTVCIPPEGNTTCAASTVSGVVHSLETISSDATNCTMSCLPTYEQYVTCTTRLEKTIDLCYGNIIDAYKSINKSAIGTSDHDAVQLLPKYVQKLKRSKAKTRLVKVWSD